MADRVQLVYAGNYRDRATGKPKELFCELNGDNSIKSPLQFQGSKHFKGLGIGNIYSFEFTIEGEKLSLFPSSRQYVKQWDNKEQIIKWRLDSEAKQVVEQLRRNEKLANSKQVFFDALKPIIEAYQNTNYVGQMAIEVLVLRLIRSGRV